MAKRERSVPTSGFVLMMTMSWAEWRAFDRVLSSANSDSSQSVPEFVGNLEARNLTSPLAIRGTARFVSFRRCPVRRNHRLCHRTCLHLYNYLFNHRATASPPGLEPVTQSMLTNRGRWSFPQPAAPRLVPVVPRPPDVTPCEYIGYAQFISQTQASDQSGEGG